MNELCACHRLAQRRCECGEPLCEQCFRKYAACKECIAILNASTDESDALQLAQWECEQTQKEM
jgi:hypothetical protein